MVIRLSVAVGRSEVRQIMDEIRSLAAQISLIETGNVLRSKVVGPGRPSGSEIGWVVSVTASIPGAGAFDVNVMSDFQYMAGHS